MHTWIFKQLIIVMLLLEKKEQSSYYYCLCLNYLIQWYFELNLKVLQVFVILVKNETVFKTENLLTLNWNRKHPRCNSFLKVKTVFKLRFTHLKCKIESIHLQVHFPANLNFHCIESELAWIWANLQFEIDYNMMLVGFWICIWCWFGLHASPDSCLCWCLQIEEVGLQINRIWLQVTDFAGLKKFGLFAGSTEFSLWNF